MRVYDGDNKAFTQLHTDTVVTSSVIPRSIISPPAAGRRLLLLLLAAQPRHDRDGHRVRGVDRLQPVGAEQREAGDPEEGVEDVGLVARLVGDAAVVLVLRV